MEGKADESDVTEPVWEFIDQLEKQWVVGARLSQYIEVGRSTTYRYCVPHSTQHITHEAFLF